MNPFSFAMPSSITLLLVLAWGVAGYYAGDYNRNNAWLAKQAVAESQALKDLQAAQDRGDALSNGLIAQQTQINQLKLENHDALNRATTGRACLGVSALRVLNAAPGIRVNNLPQATGSAAAASEPASTDTDIALWIADTGAAFEVCRSRLDALIDWNSPQRSATPPL